ncbi:hypothetical protein ACFWAR_02230 [Streptomyces sp. NPDC059917]|uniref:hypothetical protein n=1 Tax=Streptomyces sp. NPDC059917 TaxID=3347002 RepID=UPI00365C4CBA
MSGWQESTRTHIPQESDMAPHAGRRSPQQPPSAWKSSRDIAEAWRGDLQAQADRVGHRGLPASGLVPRLIELSLTSAGRPSFEAAAPNIP